MSNKFEDIVYRCPGEHSLPGGSYDYRGVKSRDELEEALSDGWFNTIDEAIEGKHLPNKAGQKVDGALSADDVASDVAEDGGTPAGPSDDETEPSGELPAPTREEMEIKAKELKEQGINISFNWRTSDEKLLERINEALAE